MPEKNKKNGKKQGEHGENQKPDTVLVHKQVLENVFGYLGTQPFKQVEPLINQMRSSIMVLNGQQNPAPTPEKSGGK